MDEVAAARRRWRRRSDRRRIRSGSSDRRSEQDSKNCLKSVVCHSGDEIKERRCWFVGRAKRMKLMS
ncbi:hypothetical protein KCP76_14855 [Salmonella enterica subsp. enterica serovar Weltevreden]|nr:hypothetical protein KCP76_14855 [Salmonella enterica subsp. enterica serovar Weltevreden]